MGLSAHDTSVGPVDVIAHVAAAAEVHDQRQLTPAADIDTQSQRPAGVRAATTAGQFSLLAIDQDTKSDLPLAAPLVIEAHDRLESSRPFRQGIACPGGTMHAQAAVEGVARQPQVAAGHTGVHGEWPSRAE